MEVSYDVFIAAFLDKIREFEFTHLDNEVRDDMVVGYMRRAMYAFRRTCDVRFGLDGNPETRIIECDDETDIDEIADIISEGMIVQWLKPYAYSQENMEAAISTRDFTRSSTAELLNRVHGAYTRAQNDFTYLMREYSFNHNDLARLHT